jgi:TldD protein
MPPLRIELIEEFRDHLAALAVDLCRRLPACRYLDIRLEVAEGQRATAEDGSPRASGREARAAFGVRVIAGDPLPAPGYIGRRLAPDETPHLSRLLRAACRRAHARAVAAAAGKAAMRRSLPRLTRTLADLPLAPIPVLRDTVPASFRIDPRQVPLEAVAALALETSRSLKEQHPALVHNAVHLLTKRTRHCFASSEGACLDQEQALTEGRVTVVAERDGVSQELNDALGHPAGWEVLTDGVSTPYGASLHLLAFAFGLAEDALALTAAPACPTTESEVVVVTDPHYNALLCHEIIGHPCEADRALKMEAAYAGRSWLLTDRERHRVGEPIASPLVTAYSDPALPAYGQYRYDHEGTPGRRALHIEGGVFRGFLHSRQTAALLQAEPNGAYTATRADLVPLIRMNNTVFAAGTSDPARMIAEVDEGYYLVGHRTPSIAESREQFRISAMKVYEIRRGELGRLYRDGGLAAGSRAFLSAVDAVGNDLSLFPIPNCGKGQPMQTKRVGNGGPTLRSRARLVGGT